MGCDSVRSDRRRLISKRFHELSTAELLGILRLRAKVFVVEQDCVYEDIDGLDDASSTVHHWVADGSEVIAYARELEDGGAVTIGRVVTDAEHRSEGLAAALVSRIADNTAGEVTLEAQTQLVDWYRALGFAVSGAGYVEDGIHHTPMRHEASKD